MSTIVNLLGALLFLVVSLWIVVIFPAKFFIRSIKNEKGFLKALWIVLMLIVWPMANFVYGFLKSDKKSDKIFCVIFFVLSFLASVYVYQHFDEYLDKFSQFIPAQTTN